MKKINGDNPGNFINRLLYFYQCVRDHRKGTNYLCEVYKPSVSIFNLNTFKKTPTRLLCDAFWNSIDYKNLKLKLESNLSFFDIGCGSGSYGRYLKQLTGKYFSSYTGLDIYKNNNYPKEFNHIISNAENIYQHIEKKINFIISQSALEHIEKDSYVIEETTKKLIENNKPFVQIHMVPSSKCLWLYLWHGYRQYSKKNLSTILRQLKKKFSINALIVPIGGNHSYWTHLRYITIPVYFRKFILRDKQFDWYNQKNVEKKIIESVKKELDCNQENPVFWAIIVTSKNIDIKNDLLKKTQNL
jgi:SAM-dependent methyltransferase